ncbi:Very short patch repair protein [Poriferisphaera corsica]|uniref:Very short patch repair endonuclease n=1 Tax=Poriferisphaera corsica TaxID=2528020 RepID=A0A517YS29_9BACT|nr:Very short patch repair protein [Poriferisphaera corsica]
MTDRISPEHRSWNMSRIRSKNTKPELIVRSLLYKMGYRFRLHRKDLPGKPDIVLPKYKTVIFVHGCYWHRHADCKLAYKPKSHIHFWQNKFSKTIKRDRLRTKQIQDLGWRVIIIWECETANTEILTNKIRGCHR